MNKIHYVNGRDLSYESKLGLMAEVSELLDQNKPATKPKTAEELMLNANNAWFAFDKEPKFSVYGEKLGAMLGHVGLTLMHKSSGVQKTAQGLLCRPSLIEVSSLVVVKNGRGQGIAKALVSRTVEQWQGYGREIDAELDGVNFALVDLVAMACGPSITALTANGFSEPDNRVIIQKEWQDRQVAYKESLPSIAKVALGKLALPVMGILQIHQGE